ncbi:MAG TPA: hypothetical protein VGD05_05735 [Pyrinomonadaceae bacterium]
MPAKRVSEPIKVVESSPKEIPSPKLEKIPELETIEEVNSWFNEKYPFKIKLLETGEGFHGDEINAKSGETWLGLFEDKGEFYLRSTKLKVKRVHDPIVDEDIKIKTGKSVEASGKNEPLFLTKNAANLSEGKVSTIFKGVTWNEYDKNPALKDLYSDEVFTYIKKDFNQTYEIAGKKLRLSVIEAKNKDNQKILALTLDSDRKRQVLHTIYADGYPELGTLFWIGDLDRDGGADFYLELFEHENSSVKVLFLSSQADKDKLVKKVAYFWTSGC